MSCYPHLNDTFMTEKLKEQLLTINNYAMTLIVAPAGYGKSTAITWWDEYRRRYLPESYFYRLNISGDDLDTAWQSLCRLLQRDAPELTGKLRKIGFPKNEQTMQLLSQLCEQIEENTTKEIYIVVDDVHLLPDGPLVSLLFFLAQQLPSRFHIILLSRNSVFRQSQRLKLGRRLHQISMESFQLSSQEIYSYAHHCGLPLSEEDTEQLASFSSGWISLVYLAFCNYVQTGTWQFCTADISQLITEVMLDPLNRRARDFLAVCSVAAEFSEEQAAYLWNEPDAGLLLEKLTHENAFIVRDKEGIYRCHNLLLKNTVREFEDFPKERQQEVWERLGDWYLKQRNYLQAAFAYRKAQVWDKLLQTVAEDRNSSFGGSYMAQIHEWCENCPQQILRNHPDAVLVFALQHFIAGDIATMLHLNQFLLESVNSDPLLTEQEKANFSGESEILLGFLEFNSIIGMSRHHRVACELMDRESLLVNQHSPWTFGSPSVLALFHRDCGALDEENKSMRECMPYYYELTDHHGNGAEIAMQAETELMRGNLQDAEIHYYHASRAAHRKHQYSILLTAQFTAMRLSFLRGNYPEALGWLTDLRRQLLDINEFVLLPSIDLAQSWLFSLLGKKEQIPQSIWTEDMVKMVMGVSTPIVLTIQNEAFLTAGSYTLLVSRYEETKSLCDRNRMLLCSIYTQIQYAAALLALGNSIEARAVLSEALKLAVPDGLLLPFAEHGEQLRPLMDELKQENKDAAPWDKIAELTALFEQAKQKILVEHFGQIPDMGLSHRELEIASLAAKRKTTKEISAELNLSENTVRNHLSHIFDKLGIEGSARNKREKLEKLFPKLP